MRVSRDELLITLGTSDKGSVSTVVPLNPTLPDKSGNPFFSWLSGLAASYERIVWHKLEVSWRPAVGTTESGIICYAVDWDPKDTGAAVTRPMVTSLTPVKDHPIWQATDSMPYRAPVGFLQSRKHYVMRATEIADTCPGSLLVSLENGPASKSLVGELWIRYDVTLIGPRSAKA